MENASVAPKASLEQDTKSGAPYPNSNPNPNPNQDIKSSIPQDGKTTGTAAFAGPGAQYDFGKDYALPLVFRSLSEVAKTSFLSVADEFIANMVDRFPTLASPEEKNRKTALQAGSFHAFAQYRALALLQSDQRFPSLEIMECWMDGYLWRLLLEEYPHNTHADKLFMQMFGDQKVVDVIAPVRAFHRDWRQWANELKFILEPTKLLAQFTSTSTNSVLMLVRDIKRECKARYEQKIRLNGVMLEYSSYVGARNADVNLFTWIGSIGDNSRAYVLRKYGSRLDVYASAIIGPQNILDLWGTPFNTLSGMLPSYGLSMGIGYDATQTIISPFWADTVCNALMNSTSLIIQGRKEIGWINEKFRDPFPWLTSAFLYNLVTNAERPSVVRELSYVKFGATLASEKQEPFIANALADMRERNLPLPIVDGVPETPAAYVARYSSSPVVQSMETQIERKTFAEIADIFLARRAFMESKIWRRVTATSHLLPELDAIVSKYAVFGGAHLRKGWQSTFYERIGSLPRRARQR
jgi:hypothetical protein